MKLHYLATLPHIPVACFKRICYIAILFGFKITSFIKFFTMILICTFFFQCTDDKVENDFLSIDVFL